MKFRYDKETEELIITEASRVEYHQIDLWLTRFLKSYRFNPAFKAGVWDGKKSYFRNGRINFGLWKECMLACKEIDTPFIVENKEDFPINRDITLENVIEFCKTFFKNHKAKNDEGVWVDFMPYDHQIETAYKILKNRYCLTEVATSGGKSLIISIVFFYTINHINKDAKLLIVVPSILLVTQMYDNLLEYYYGANNLVDKTIINDVLRIEEVMSEKPRKFSGTDNANIYIGTFQSLEKWPKEFFEQFHTVVVDESHTAKNKTITSILTKTFRHAYCRFGVSGTFPTDESCEILSIQSLIGPKIAEVSADELKKKGIITPMEIKCVILNHDKPEIAERLKIIRKSDGKAAFDFEKAYCHQSTKRLDFIKKLIEKCNTNSLVLFHTIENGQRIFNKMRTEILDKEFYYIDGSVSGKDRDIIKKRMNETTGKPKILIASFGTLAVGVSINAIFNIIFTDSFKSEQIIIQSIGRGLRLHSEKEKVIIFDLVDVFDSKNFDNTLYSHYLERRTFYLKRKYPYKEIKINL